MAASQPAGSPSDPLPRTSAGGHGHGSGKTARAATQETDGGEHTEARWRPHAQQTNTDAVTAPTASVVGSAEKGTHLRFSAVSGGASGMAGRPGTARPWRNPGSPMPHITWGRAPKEGGSPSTPAQPQGARKKGGARPELIAHYGRRRNFTLMRPRKIASRNPTRPCPPSSR